MIRVYPQYLYSGLELGDLVEDNGPHWATVLKTSSEDVRPNYKIVVLKKGQAYDPVGHKIFDLEDDIWLQRLHQEAEMFGMTATDAAIKAAQIDREVV